jgi:hypothetical protein
MMPSKVDRDFSSYAPVLGDHGDASFAGALCGTLMEKVLIREVRHAATFAGKDYRNQAFAGLAHLGKYEPEPNRTIRRGPRADKRHGFRRTPGNRSGTNPDIPWDRLGN